MLNIYKIEILNHYPRIKHAISTKAFGSMKKEDGSLNFANLLKFAKTQNFPSMPICINQVHGTTIAVIENNRELILPKTDGMITNKKGLPLTIVTGDCLPILFYDPKNEVIGVAHAGRKGLAAGIIARILSHLQSTFEVNPKDIIIGVGPSIEKNCYEVDEGIINEFQTGFPDFTDIFSQKEKRYFLDLRAVAMQSLLKEGILKQHIEISDICTKCDERFYSYRRGDRRKVFASVISLI
ncbi:MAG: peptidoglycan editing factor PgeF [Candidatus Levyibacteriota bacterium]